ncbi:MAG: acetyl-CoA C-acetyltransferase [Pseudobdellovibrionaceae bacterium]|nr:acetyl-CoA C-acetyltransferase [Bdellovibrionales bacterium]USN48216.1 MAG: acetyl-CoA C-acetyltransferase [Pseudobdellovibrionaceae bacterium]
MSKEVFILSAKRTPVGSFQGTLGQVPAPRLGATAITSALQTAGIPTEQVDECIMGEVLTAGVGQAPARQAAIYAGLPTKTACMTINKVCGSGLKAVMLAADSIRLGQASVVVAGGQENMTLAPHLLENSRAGYRMGHFSTTDSMIKDGLWDPYNDFHMGVAAEMCVKEYKFSREEQDEFAKQSYEWAMEAQKSGAFDAELVAVQIQDRKETLTITEDEEPGRARFDKMTSLRPAFDKEGTVTAANASKINDGAAALVLASGEKTNEFGLTPMARVVAYATHAQDPKWFTTAPVSAIKKSLAQAGLKVDDIDLYEINEAFSNVTMAAMKDLSIPREKVNVHGGAVAIGHPIGASGARILTTLLHALKQRQKKYGLATLCIGGGEAVALIVENL